MLDVGCWLFNPLGFPPPPAYPLPRQMAVESKSLYHPEALRQQVRSFVLPEQTAARRLKLRSWPSSPNAGTLKARLAKSLHPRGRRQVGPSPSAGRRATTDQRLLPGAAALRSWLAVLAALLWIAAQTASAEISKEATWPVPAGGNGHTYRVVAPGGLISWNSANAQATAAGGYLATITSAEENAFVFSLVDDPAYWTQSINDHGPWIGGFQPAGSSEPAGGWTWVTAPDASAPESFVYAHWTAGEPNNLTAVVGGITYNQDRIAFFNPGTGRAATWSDEFNLTGTSLNQWTISYVIEFTGVLPVLQNPRIIADGSFQFSFTNYPSASFEVLTTTNLALPLTDWTSLGNVPQAPPGLFQFTDPQAASNPRRFYRVRSP
jgi:hypothetical protein